MEFLLIVVGINLGLFVNNLNEQRKETKHEARDTSVRKQRTFHLRPTSR